MAVLLLLIAIAGPTELEECQRLASRYQAETEVRLWDETRVDLLSDEFAIEVDWPHKWAEAIGQSLYYAEVTGRKPAVILLVKDAARERRFVYRAAVVCARVHIRLFVEKSASE